MKLTQKPEPIQSLAEGINIFQNFKEDFEPEDIWLLDWSKPSPEEAESLLTIYNAILWLFSMINQDESVKYGIDLVFGEKTIHTFAKFAERISTIEPELNKIFKQNATEEDYEELIWQNDLANKRDKLKSLESTALVEIAKGDFVEGGWNEV